MPPKIPPKKIPREQAKVLFSYTAENEDELTIKEGDIVNIISKEVEDKGWMQAELNNKIGLIPDNFIQIIKPNPISNQTPNNAFKNATVTNNFNSNNSSNLNNGTKTGDDNSPPKLPVKKTTPENIFSKGITSKFIEVLSKSNSSLNETSQKSSTPLFMKQQANSFDEKAITTTTQTSTTSTTTTNSTTGVAPSLPLKKSKLFSTPKSFNKDSNDELNERLVESDLNSIIDEQKANNSVKLTHLTASRVKGPTNRRPPSIIQVSRDDEPSLASSNSLNNLSDLNCEKKETHHSSDNLDDSSPSLSQTNKELSKQSSKNNSISEMSKVTTPTNQQPPWMVELKKTQAEKKNEVKMKTKNFSVSDESSSNVSGLNQSNQTTSLTSFNGTSPNSSKKTIITPNSPTKMTPNRMSGDYSQRFKDFLQAQNTSNTNSLSRHSSVNNHFNNSSRTLSTDSLDCKEQQTSMLGFGQLASPFASVVKPVKAAKPTSTKFLSNSPTTTGQNSILNNSNLINQTTVTTSSSIQTKDTVSRKEFEDLQKKVNDLSDTFETQKQTYKGLIKSLINDIAEEKKKVANLTIEVDRLRKLTTTV